MDAGADGVFFATKWASSKHMSWEEYEQFGKPYEIEILNALRSRKAWLILHVCGDQTYLDRMLDYDVDVFSYDFFAGGAPDPQDVVRRTGRFVLGGLDPERLADDPESALSQLQSYSRLDRWMAGPSCVLPPRVPDAAIKQFTQYLSRMRS
jgi:uroporphyrinogen decarboxylase